MMAEGGGLLVVLAHPDDETLCSGAMARYAARGMPVTMLCATRGEVGQIAEGSEATPETLGKFREQELRDAMVIMGVHDVRFLGFRDSGMAGTEDNEDQRALAKAHPEGVEHLIVRAIRELKPKVVVTWDSTGGYGHPDHIAVHERTKAAFEAAGDPSRFPTSGQPHTPAALFYSLIPIEDFQAMQEELRRQGIGQEELPGDGEALSSMERLSPNTRIDISDAFDRKLEAIRAHRTQQQDWETFSKLSLEFQKQFFGCEHYYRATPPVKDGVVLDDLFDGLS
jgi:LmbE family N-acetylglucosaminyl deacetylase